MTSTYSRVFRIIVTLHLVLILILVLWPVFAKWFQRSPPAPEIAFVELVQPSSSEPVPENREQPDPEPEPEPEPEPVIPKKVAPKPPPLKKAREIQVNTNRVVKKETVKPAKKPELSEEKIRKLLESGLPVGTASTASSADVNELSAYYGHVQSALFAAWSQPAGAPGLLTEVSIRVGKGGAILQKRITSRSGNASMDESVQKALNAVSKLRPLPSSIREAYLEITIDFESTGLTN